MTNRHIFILLIFTAAGLLVFIFSKFGWEEKTSARGESKRSRPDLVDGSEPSRGSSSGETSAPGSGEDDRHEQNPSIQRVFGDLESACLSGDRDRLIESALVLRELITEDPSLLVEVEAALGDRENGHSLRGALAVVLGSLPGGEGKAILARALSTGAAAGLERRVAFALNMVVEETPPMFRRDGHPYSVEVLSGLVVFVRGAIEDPDARAAVGSLFRSPEADVRLAAARVLRDSMEFSDARDAIRRHLSEAEPGEEVRAEAAAALAHWSKSMSPDDETERSEIVSELLGSLSGSSEVVRFRLTSPLAQTTLTTEQATQLRVLASSGEEDVRRTVIEILGRRLSISPEEQAETVALFVEVTANDPSAQVRETSAMSLRGASTAPGAAEALVRAATSDADPEVRAAATASLASFTSNPAARETLVDVRDNDPSELVRASARRALGAH